METIQNNTINGPLTNEERKNRLISLLNSTEPSSTKVPVVNEFLLRNPLYTKKESKGYETRIDKNGREVQIEIFEFHTISIFHEVYHMDKQKVLAAQNIGYLHHLGDNEDDCPKLSTFVSAYGEHAIRWFKSQLSVANARVSTTNRMNILQIDSSAPAIIERCSEYDLDLNLAEVMYFFGNISKYMAQTKDTFTFGETQIISALNVFKKDRYWQLADYDRKLKNEREAARREEWKKGAVTWEEWAASPEGKKVIKMLKEDGKTRDTDIISKIQQVTNPQSYKDDTRPRR